MGIFPSLTVASIKPTPVACCGLILLEFLAFYQNLLCGSSILRVNYIIRIFNEDTYIFKWKQHLLLFLLLTALHFTWVVHAEDISVISLILISCAGVITQFSSGFHPNLCIFYAYEHQQTKRNGSPRSKDQNPTLFSPAHQSIICFPFSLLTPTASQSNSVVTEKHYSSNKTFKNLWLSCR